MEPTPARQQRRVLVVDDDPSLSVLLTEGLRRMGGYDVVVAHDGVSGLERYFEVQPDCVVVDVRMPNLNGYQMVRALRGDPTTAQTPIIVLSALVQQREELAGLLTGADAYLFKPVTMADLLQTLDRSMRLSAEERQQRYRGLTEDN